MDTLVYNHKIFNKSKFESLQEELREKCILDASEGTEITANLQELVVFNEKLICLRTNTIPKPISYVLIIICIIFISMIGGLAGIGWPFMITCVFMGGSIWWFIKSINQRLYYLKHYDAAFQNAENAIDLAMQSVQDDVREFTKKLDPNILEHLADLLTSNGASHAVAQTLVNRLKTSKCTELESLEGIG